MNSELERSFCGNFVYHFLRSFVDIYLHFPCIFIRIYLVQFSSKWSWIIIKSKFLLLKTEWGFSWNVFNWLKIIWDIFKKFYSNSLTLHIRRLMELVQEFNWVSWWNVGLMFLPKEFLLKYFGNILNFTFPKFRGCSSLYSYW